MDLSQYFTSSDITGIAPEIILTLTALVVLTLEMARVNRPGIILLVAAFGFVLAGAAIVQEALEIKFFSAACFISASFQCFLIFFISLWD